MNLWFRLRAYLFTARWRPALVLPEGVSVLRFRAWPTDLDPSVHVNNGKYLSLITSGLNLLKCGIQALELYTGVGRGEVPIGFGVVCVAAGPPCDYLFRKRLGIGDAAGEALA